MDLNHIQSAVGNGMEKLVEDLDEVVGKFAKAVQFDIPQNLSTNTGEPMNLLVGKFKKDSEEIIREGDEEANKLLEKIRQKEKDVKQLEEELKELQNDVANAKVCEQKKQSSDKKLEDMKNVVKVYKSLTNTHIAYNSKFVPTEYIEGYVEHEDEVEVFRLNTNKLSAEQISQKYCQIVDKLYKGNCSAVAKELLDM